MNQSNWRPAALSLTVAGALSRFLLLPGNFSPVGAVSLFGGARLAGPQAYLIPLAIMAVTDPILNLMRGFPAFTPFQIFTYVSFLISVAIGRQLRSTENAWKIGAAVLASSIQFFLISNLGSFFFMNEYPRTLAGLGTCYVAALPFFERTLASDLLFTAALFTLHAVLSRTVAGQERVAATA